MSRVFDENTVLRHISIHLPAIIVRDIFQTRVTEYHNNTDIDNRLRFVAYSCIAPIRFNITLNISYARVLITSAIYYRLRRVFIQPTIIYIESKYVEIKRGKSISGGKNRRHSHGRACLSHRPPSPSTLKIASVFL